MCPLASCWDKDQRIRTGLKRAVDERENRCSLTAGRRFTPGNERTHQEVFLATKWFQTDFLLHFNTDVSALS
ncbi:hypothetical protein EYF80_057890 [Liparis tanakae]|uniref:Uncharacterized protein n=1 Tax=Liparis tanakae TaxID=230148 RepID=A0A4Z2ESY0_9TELE|nr:hypothetical protein EYF80_057890 [Liparis tanakae]